jgi:hypothetical protein
VRSIAISAGRPARSCGIADGRLRATGRIAR